MTRTLIQLATLACLISGSLAGSTKPSTSSSNGPQVAIHSADDFCLFLPPSPGLEVAVNEDNGIPFCSKANDTPNAKEFPQGFVQVAHYAKTSKYVQVTGYFDRSTYQLSAQDGGGQYDSHAKHKPVGATCQGYPFFVSLIEPDIQRFCIRCCKNTADCNTGRSGYGCLRVVSGNYSKSNSTHSNTAFDSVLDELPPADSYDSPKIPDNGSSSDASPLDAFPEAIDHLESALASNPTVEQLKSQWDAFIQQLAARYPNVAQKIRSLGALADNFTSVDEWRSFVTALKQKIPAHNQDQNQGQNQDQDQNHNQNTDHNNEWVDA
ncbi:hypothetical protein DFQ28_010265 [Apophysomyces sp. BC1034]|nr:hypothetical protein DFQ29_009349 [Apophysomyces sp. BC1021]KAG0173243.1 hypothetical protein DFQ30_008512 [Apophysomyces sp. BC1015]KAG0184912.1 hypothetical protein DFQ28_010265 [Apophysomyces sp. BC1034]